VKDNWIAHHVLCLVPAYNTNLVSAAEAPKSWDDLLDPKWNKAISMDKDGGDWVLMLWSAWGKEKTVNYLKQLARNNLVFGEGAGARTQMLAAGAVKLTCAQSSSDSGVPEEETRRWIG